VLVMAGISLGVLTGCGGGSSSSSSGSSTSAGSQATDQATAAAHSFLDRYVTSDGRVQRLDQGGDTVGEGQAYGLLLAAAIGDSQHFDSIWNWTKANLRRQDGLIEFHWQDGHVTDPQAASDADLDAARALLVASCRFKRPELRQEALGIGKSILNEETASVNGNLVLTAGPWATKAPVTVNPSYFSPATFAALQSATGDGRWGSLAASARSITSELMQPPSKLPPDWAQLQNGKPTPIGSPASPQSTPQFGFDAVRTLVRMAEDPNPAGKQIAASAWTVFQGQNPDSIPVQHSLSGQPDGGAQNPVGLVAAAGAASAAGEAAARDQLLDAATALDKRDPTYYGSAWVALGRIMLTTKLLDVCS
jgi:endoglucanase